MNHDWKHGWKEIRGYYVDVCKRCGFAHLIGIDDRYLSSEEAVKFLTTTKSVAFVPYQSCGRIE